MGIFDELKSVGNVLQEAGKIEQYRQILDAQKELLEMQKRVADLEKDNGELKRKLEIKESLKYENSAYWIEKGGKKDGPFCSRCWDVEKNMVRMNQGVNNPAFHTCPECKSQPETDPNFRPMYTSRKPPNQAR